MHNDEGTAYLSLIMNNADHNYVESLELV